MIVIALDTASRTSALVLRTDGAGTIQAERQLPGGELDRRLPGAIAGLIDGGVDAVVVLTGPGSYTGVRAGMAAALGLASARGLPLHGLGNLVAIAAAVRSDDASSFVAVADAGRGGLYVASFQPGDGGPEQVSGVRRCHAAELDQGVRAYTTTPLESLEAERLEPRVALAAAVPRALGSAPLGVAGLSAIHAHPC